MLKTWNCGKSSEQMNNRVEAKSNFCFIDIGSFEEAAKITPRRLCALTIVPGTTIMSEIQIEKC